MENSNKKMIAVYGRVSTSNQENEGTIETQLSSVVEFAEKNNCKIVQKYVDEGWSGDSLARPALDQLRQDAKKKIWEAVLIYDPDRLARRYSYQELVMDELREAGIEVLFVTVPTAKSDEDKIMYGMRGLFSQYERMKIAERFRLGKVRKAKENNIIASEAPYGYTFIKKNGKRGDSDFHQGYYEINPTEAEVVKNIFSWIADEGLTIRKVVKRLHELAILPRKSKRGVWNTSTLGSMLRNKTYIGEAHYGASYAVAPVNPFKKEGYKKIKKTSRKIRPESEWITITSPAILDKEIFFRAQEQLKINATLSPRNKKNQYLLSGKLICDCGNKRVGEGPQRGKFLYYRCTARVHSYPLPPTCTQKGINVRIVDKLVWDKLAELMSSPELMLKQAERWISKKQAAVNKPAENSDRLNKDIQKLKAQEERYIRAYGAEMISMEKLKELTLPIRESISKLENQMVKADSPSDQSSQSYVPTLDEARAFAEKATKALKDLSFEEKRVIVLNTIEKVTGTKEELSVHGYLPITSHNVGYKTLNRNRRLAKRRQVHPL